MVHIIALVMNYVVGRKCACTMTGDLHIMQSSGWREHTVTSISSHNHIVSFVSIDKVFHHIIYSTDIHVYYCTSYNDNIAVLLVSISNIHKSHRGGPCATSHGNIIGNDRIAVVRYSIVNGTILMSMLILRLIFF